MTKNLLSQHLKAVHDHFVLFLHPDAVETLDGILKTITGDPAQLRPQKPPTARTVPLRPPDVPPTYFRMNERLDLVEVAPPLLELLEVESPDQLLGSNWEHFLAPDELKRFWEQWMVAAQTRMGFTYLFRFRTPKGRELVLREYVMPLRDNVTLAFHGWFGYVTAVSKVIKIEEPRRSRADDQRSA